MCLGPFSPFQLSASVTVLWHGNVAAVCTILHHQHASQSSVSLVLPVQHTVRLQSLLTVLFTVENNHPVEQSRLSCNLFICNCARRRHCCVWGCKDSQAALPQRRTQHSGLQCKCRMSGCIATQRMRHTAVGATCMQCSDSTTQRLQHTTYWQPAFGHAIVGVTPSAEHSARLATPSDSVTCRAQRCSNSSGNRQR